jgi:hypothetical protein
VNFEVQLQNFKKLRHLFILYFSRNKETAWQNECSVPLMDVAAFELLLHKFVRGKELLDRVTGRPKNM